LDDGVVADHAAAGAERDAEIAADVEDEIGLALGAAAGQPTGVLGRDRAAGAAEASGS
jgi:hypothetical protein